MSYTKTDIYNLTCSALLLGKEFENVETDTSNEVRVLNIHWNTAFDLTLRELDLDSLSTPVTLELIEELEDSIWTYAYKYPSNCAFLRRIESCVLTDNSRTHIPKRVGQYLNQKAIFTNEADAVAEIIPKDFELAILTPEAALAIAYKLALLSAPLLTGKGAKALKETIKLDYMMVLGEAKEMDAAENRNFESDDVRSEFVAERLS